MGVRPPKNHIALCMYLTVCGYRRDKDDIVLSSTSSQQEELMGHMNKDPDKIGLALTSSKYENSTAMFCYKSSLASTHARRSIAKIR